MSTHASSRLVVFSDDWGRHPSSCQHLVRHLLDEHEVIWVNTVGMRRPRLTISDAKRTILRIRDWTHRATPTAGNPRIVSPTMYPGFRRPWQRRLNAKRMADAVNRALDDAPASDHCVAVTTLPVTADLIGAVDVDSWIYYCVDDFSVWPGLDGNTLQAMEVELVRHVDQVVCVSQVLQERLRRLGREAPVLTHGVDLDHWRQNAREANDPTGDDSGIKLLFWGLIDPRLDASWCHALQNSGVGQLILAGPEDQPTVEPSMTRLGPIAYDRLPALAMEASVLVMPYVDAPVTRAMQPLKLLEYLATYKPVVVRDLPATRDWADCCDVVATAEEFVEVCRQRAEGGLPPDQAERREQRLSSESWSEKARWFQAMLHEAVTFSR